LHNKMSSQHYQISYFRLALGVLLSEVELLVGELTSKDFNATFTGFISSSVVLAML